MSDDLFEDNKRSGDKPDDRLVPNDPFPSLDSESFKLQALNPNTTIPLAFEIQAVTAADLEMLLYGLQSEIREGMWGELFDVLEAPTDTLPESFIDTDGLLTIDLRQEALISEVGQVDLRKRTITISNAFNIEAPNLQIILSPAGGTDDFKANVLLEFVPDEFSDPESFWEQAGLVAKTLRLDLERLISNVQRQDSDYVVTQDGIQLRFGDMAAFLSRTSDPAGDPEIDALVTAQIEVNNWGEYPVVQALSGQSLSSFFAMLASDQSIAAELPRVLVFDSIVVLQDEFASLEAVFDEVTATLQKRTLLHKDEAVPVMLEILTARPSAIVDVLRSFGVTLDQNKALALIDLIIDNTEIPENFLENLYLTGREIHACIEQFAVYNFEELRITFEIEPGHSPTLQNTFANLDFPIILEFALSNPILEGLPAAPVDPHLSLENRSDPPTEVGDLAVRIKVPGHTDMYSEAVAQLWEITDAIVTRFGLTDSLPTAESESRLVNGAISYWLKRDPELPSAYNGVIAIDLLPLEGL